MPSFMQELCIYADTYAYVAAWYILAGMNSYTKYIQVFPVFSGLAVGLNRIGGDESFINRAMYISIVA